MVPNVPRVLLGPLGYTWDVLIRLAIAKAMAPLLAGVAPLGLEGTTEQSTYVGSFLIANFLG